jgi:hypothetical protein
MFAAYSHKSPRIVALSYIDSQFVELLKMELFRFTYDNYLNSMVSAKHDTSATNHMNYNPLLPRPTARTRLYLIEVLVSELRYDMDNSVDTLIERILKIVQQLTNESQWTTVKLVQLPLDSKSSLPNHIDRITKEDPYIYINNFQGAVLHINTRIQQSARQYLDEYLEALENVQTAELAYQNEESKENQVALSNLKATADELYYRNFTTDHSFFTTVAQGQKEVVLKTLVSTMMKLHRNGTSLREYEIALEGWSEQVRLIINKWIRSVNSASGPHHKQKHILIWGEPNMGKTQLVLKKLFRYLHQSVCT